MFVSIRVEFLKFPASSLIDKWQTCVKNPNGVKQLKTRFKNHHVPRWDLVRWTWSPRVASPWQRPCLQVLPQECMRRRAVGAEGGECYDGCVCVVGYVGHGTIWWLWWLLLFMTSKIEFGFEVSRWQCAKTEEYVEAIPGTIPIQLASARCGDMMGDLYMFYVVDTTQLWLRLRIRLSRIWALSPWTTHSLPKRIKLPGSSGSSLYIFQDRCIL